MHLPTPSEEGQNRKPLIGRGGAATATRRTQSTHGTQRTGNVRTCRILIVRCSLQRSADLCNTSTPPMASIPPPFPPLMSGFPLGYVIFSTFLSLGSHDFPLDHHLPDFQASHPGAPPFLPGRAPFPSPPFLLECRRLAVLQVVLRVYSLRLRLLNLFSHKQIRANRHQHHLPCLQRRMSVRNLPFLALKSEYDTLCQHP